MGQVVAEATLFEVESMFVMETPIETPFPLWMEVVFRDTVSRRFALLGMLRLRPASAVIDDEVVTVVVLMVVLVTALVIVLVVVLVWVTVPVVVLVWVTTEGITTVSVVVLVWVICEETVTVSAPRPPPPAK